MTGTTASALAAGKPGAAFVQRKTLQAPKPGVLPLGAYPTLSPAMPTVTISGGNEATAISGSVVDVAGVEQPASFVSAEWSATTAYTAGQGVMYPTANDRLYICTSPNTGVPPVSDRTRWRLAAADPRIAFLGGPVTNYRLVASGTGFFQLGTINGFLNTSIQRSVTPCIGYYGSLLEVRVPGAGGQIRFTIDGVADRTGERTLTDIATTSASGVITSSTAAFTSDDIGRIVQTANPSDSSVSPASVIPINSYIASVQSATQATLSKNATATTTAQTVRIVGGWKTIPSDSKVYRVRAAFPVADHRVIAVECALNNFLGFTISSLDALHRPPEMGLPRMIALGDSITQGQATDGTRLETFVQYLARIMGWDGWEAGVGGGGYLNGGPVSTGGNNQYLNRLGVVAPHQPAVLLVAGGLNDQLSNGFTIAQITAAVASFVTAARATLPNTLLVLVGPFFTADATGDPSGTASTKTVRDAQLAAVSALPGWTYDSVNAVGRADNLIYVDTFPTWLTGKHQTTGGTGSSQTLLSFDGIHPLQSGHRYYAKRIATAIQTALAPSDLV